MSERAVRASRSRVQSKGIDERTSEHLHQDLGHALLMRNIAVILDREHHWIRRCQERTLFDGFTHISEQQFARQRVAMVDDRFSSLAVPAIH